MIRNVKLFVVVVSFLSTVHPSDLLAQVPVTWDGGNGRWETANWTKEGVSGLTATEAMGDNTGGQWRSGDFHWRWRHCRIRPEPRRHGRTRRLQAADGCDGREAA